MFELVSLSTPYANPNSPNSGKGAGVPKCTQNNQYIRITFGCVCTFLIRSGDIIIKRRMSSSEDRARRPSLAEDCRKQSNDATTSALPAVDRRRRQLSKSDTLTGDGEGQVAATRAAAGQQETGAGAGTVVGVRRKMSESSVLALIKEQSTSRDESETSSSQRGTTSHGKIWLERIGSKFFLTLEALFLI